MTCQHVGVEVDNPAMDERRWVCGQCLVRVRPGSTNGIQWYPCTDDGVPIPVLPMSMRMERR